MIPFLASVTFQAAVVQSPAVDLVGAAMIVSAVVQALKPFIEAIIPPGNKLHDATLRLTAWSLGVGVVLVSTAASNGLAAPVDVINAIVAGLSVGGGSTVVYRLFVPQPATPSTPPLLPPPAPIAVGVTTSTSAPVS